MIPMVGRARPHAGQSRAHGLLEGDRTANGPARQWLRATIFRRPGHPTRHVAWGPGALCIAKQNSRASPSSAALRPFAVASGAGPFRPPSGDRHEGRDGRGRSDKGPDHDDRSRRHEFEPPHSSSPTDHVLNEIQLYGFRPFHDEPDPRPLPEGDTIAGAVADIFDALVATLSDTRLEPDLEDLLWSTVNLFHRAVDRIERELDDNELAQRRSQREQNGSEIQSVELERLTAEGITLIERRNCMELFRDLAAEQLREPHRLVLAAALRIEGQPSHPHLGDDRQS